MISIGTLVRILLRILHLNPFSYYIPHSTSNPSPPNELDVDIIEKGISFLLEPKIDGKV
jgi:hypothetical protein